MRRIAAFFTHKWFVVTLGLIALGLLVWFIGPLFAFAGMVPLESPSVRWAVIATIVALVVGNGVLQWWLARRRNAKMLAGMNEAEPAPPDPAIERADEEVDVLTTRFGDALETLKKAKLGGGRQRLYELPWYMLIGPPGSGKTTILANSGLRFPLGEGEGVRGVGGTRNCDWWFTEQAVLLDTAGRYTTQDSHRDVDSAAWEGFLALLKKHRRRRPINGALIAISASDLLAQDETTRRAHARAIRQRVRELHERLGVRFPVYLMFTKLDLVSGFAEFFDDLGREERAQVWGMTFPASSVEHAEDVTEEYGAQFDGLVARLNERLFERMQDERDLERRTRLFVFPQAFAALGPVTEAFTREVFEPTRYEQTPLLRGVYFTSGTQEGNPVNRLMDTMAQVFGVRRQSGQGTRLPGQGGRSYFITRLLKEVVFPEANLAGTNHRLERAMAWLQRGAYALITIAVIGGTAAFWNSYRHNHALVTEVEAGTDTAIGQLATLEDEAEDPVFTVPALSTLGALPVATSPVTGEPNNLPKSGRPPTSHRLGLYQGTKLGRAANRGYHNVLRNQFLPRFMLQLENRIKVELASDKPNNELLYEVLKVYLMLEDTEHFSRETIEEWVGYDWNRRYGRTQDDDARMTMEAGLATLLDNWPSPLPLELDGEIVEGAREVLGRLRPADRVYARVKAEVAAGGKAPPLVLTDLVRDMDEVFVSRSGQALDAPVPGLFTVAGYDDGFKPSLGRVASALDAEKWVLGPRAERLPGARDLDALQDEVTRLYMDDYITTWDDRLADLSLAPFSSLGQAAEMLATLSGSDSPLLKLLALATQETTLTRAGAGDALAQRAAERGLRRFIERSGRLNQIIGGEDITSGAGDSLIKRDLTPVDQHFARLHEYVNPDSSGNAQLDRVMKQVNDLFEQIHALDLEPNRDRAIREMTEGQGSNAIGRLDRLGGRTPAPLDRWVPALALNARSLATTGLQASLNDLWEGGGRRLCEQSIASRYPFDRSATVEVRLEDFTRYFGPKGASTLFFNEYLARYVDTSSSPWTSQRQRQGGLRLSPEALTQFERAAAISEAYFPNGSATPLVNFELTPIAMDSGIKRLTLDIEGQAVSYRHGPVRPTPLRWPGPGARQVRIDLQPPLPGGRSGLSLEGPWAWFRFLERFSMRPTADPERFDITFDVDGRQARYGLRAGSAFNPFALPALDRFECPTQL